MRNGFRRGHSKVVIGISGGLDSTHALLVCAKAMDRLNCRARISRRHHARLRDQRPDAAAGAPTDGRRRLLGERDRHPAELRADAEGSRPSVRVGREQYDITFENVQAGERTNHLFRLANFKGGIVVGTGDLSELALGWCTYGVGDHMSHYSVNASVPKTLITHLVRWVAETGQIGDTGSDVLINILNTDISPELVPGKTSGVRSKRRRASSDRTSCRISTSTTRCASASRQRKSRSSLHRVERSRRGRLAGRSAHVARNEYELPAIKQNLGIFLDRFFRTSQFKRSCMPNAPKVGSGGSLSPRGDWRAPSDSESVVWMNDLKNIPVEGVFAPYLRVNSPITARSRVMTRSSR